MANIIPPLVSETPPPPPSDDEDDDEFDDFRGSNDISYGCDSFSLSSPEQSPKKLHKEVLNSKDEPVLYLESEKNDIDNSKETLQANDLERSKDKDENLVISTDSLKEDITESTNESSGSKSKESDDFFSKNNYVNQELGNNITEDIPGQLIIENNSSHESKICDNSDKPIKNNPDISNEDTNELNTSNGCSLEDADSIKKITSFSDYSSGTTWSADFISSDNYESNLESEFSISSDNANLKSVNKDEEFSDFSKDVNTDDLEKLSSTINKNIETEDLETISKSTHSKNIRNTEKTDLVKDKNLQNDSQNNFNHNGDNTDFKIDSEDEDFGTFASQTIFDSSPKFAENEVEHINAALTRIKETKYLETEDKSFVQSQNCSPDDDLSEASKYVEHTDYKSETNTQKDTSSEIFQGFPVFGAHDVIMACEFGDFENFTSVTEGSTEQQKQDVKEDETSEFGVFTSSASQEDNDFGDFGNFTSQAPPSTSKEESSTGVGDDDDFDDFASFPATTDPKGVNPDVPDDGFGDFGNFTTSTSDLKPDNQSLEDALPVLDVKEVFKKTEEVVKDIFVLPEEEQEDFIYFELGKDDFIFKQIQDITDSPALTYHWSKSSSQKYLLNSLNIDARNILHGHNWNPSVPKFAANLGVQPLEPIKMESLTPSPSKPTPPAPQISSQSSQEAQDVPSAQFDWTNSGLVNPLDYSSNEPPTQPVKPKAAKSISPSVEFEEFTSFQSSKSSEQPQIPSWPSVPLRETYISDVTQSHIDVDVCLQPTIVTPELPRKGISEDYSVFNETNLAVKDIVEKHVDDVEFDDFQSFPDNVEHSSNKIDADQVPEKKLSGDSIHDKSILQLTPISTGSKTNDETITQFDAFVDKNTFDNTVEFSKPSIPEITNIFPEMPSNPVQEPVKTLELQPKTSGDNNEGDDDFTEFHSSVPLPQLQATPMPTILEPLKPVPVYSNAPSSQINWPDPGVTDDEIRRFEEVFSVPLNQVNEEKLSFENKQEKPKKDKPSEVKVNNNFSTVHTKKPEIKENARTDFPLWDTSPEKKPYRKQEFKPEPKKIEAKPNPIEDDEWSDFVSVQKPSPIHKAKFSDRNQTSSPDLPLSVLNLGSIQPAKQPIPVITPRGLVQTKLSTNMNPVNQQKSNLIHPKPSYGQPVLQPSIISNQFASQAYNVGMNAPQPYNFISNMSQSSTSSGTQKSSHTITNIMANGQEDDEWGEFVSSPLPPQLQNSSTTVGHSWNQFVSNPVRLNNPMTGIRDHRRSNSSGGQKKGSHVPGMVLPDLDFKALKERSSVTRKK
ncbi:aftiphilin [Diabrotica virgifera virgifera]|uniref:Aftiphilin n=1 Tax=Diabrotica virgifera virgifera TaxID=50390 RepID=A0A6P7F879_DIAVI|nr:aftiphilin [Diabrotica virgifera virgifera]XP_028132000.1 aftiphilin [Diabrotica virgifera virgifera]